MESTIKMEVAMPHKLALHLAFLGAAQGVSPEQALIDLVQEDKEAWEHNDKVTMPGRVR
jgi:hypothetical protein